MADPAVKQAIDKWAALFGVPTYVAETIAQEESGMTNAPPTMDTNGAYSVGPFQLNLKGQGAVYSLQQLENPDFNAYLGVKNLVPAVKAGEAQGLSGYALVEYVAAHSGHPGYSGTLPSSYEQQLQKAYETVTGQTPDGSSVPVTDVSTGTYTPPSGITGYITRAFWGLLGIALIALGLWIAMNPFADLTSAIRDSARALAKMPLEGAADYVRSLPYQARYRRAQRTQSARTSTRASARHRPTKGAIGRTIYAKDIDISEGWG